MPKKRVPGCSPNPDASPWFLSAKQDHICDHPGILQDLSRPHLQGSLAVSSDAACSGSVVSTCFLKDTQFWKKGRQIYVHPSQPWCHGTYQPLHEYFYDVPSTDAPSSWFVEQGLLLLLHVAVPEFAAETWDLAKPEGLKVQGSVKGW